MKNRFSVVLFLVLSCFLLAVLNPSPVQAAAGDIVPFWDVARNITQELTIDTNSKAHINVSLWASSSGCDEIKITTQLQQNSGRGWSTLATFNAAGQSPICNLIEQYTVARGAEYRIVSTFKLYKNSILVEAIDDVDPFYYGWYE